ncbi:hypothetical protein LVB77_07660 [Lysobacter sp. 5GHs7-4]|uniref:hypothetical protein n=1 Tax=Lysobacter sp. 5GHs7-4 TaxID=2904253 RepID=UPI001E523031|nr:hypothetical protein [Lysobacter sp. 5GHs7-4]UHQ24550.1 hypothetical protein LVB77_07660 [Lysobacter sp. 5GHs7-4]
MSAAAPAVREPLQYLARRWLTWLVLLATAAMFLVGIAMLAGTLDWNQNVFDQIGHMAAFAGDLVGVAIESFSKAPKVAIYVAVLVTAYAVAPWLLARTRRERRLALCHIVVAPLAAGLCVMAVVAKVLAGMAM